MSIGGKAENLRKIAVVQGASIPPWDVLDASHFEVHTYGMDQSLSLAEKRAYIQENPVAAATIAKIHEIVRRIGGSSFAVRSSCDVEDSAKASYAGRFDSKIDINVENVVDAVKSVWASAFTDRAQGELESHDAIPKMAVIIQEAVAAKVAGVITTQVLSNGLPAVEIACAEGMGEQVVDGKVPTDSWVVHNDTVIERVIHGESALFLDGVALKIACLAKRIEALYRVPVDIEFAIDQESTLRILQARVLVQREIVGMKTVAEGEPIASGLFSVPGVASGAMRYIASREEAATVQPGEIVLAHVTTNSWTQHLRQASALITQEGAPSSHPMLLSRELGIPCVVGIDTAHFEQLRAASGEEVTVDGLKRAVFEGRPELVDAHPEELFAPTRVRPFPNMEQILPAWRSQGIVFDADDKTWRQTPSYPIVGFQQEINAKRMHYIGEILGRGFDQAYRVVDDIFCIELRPFSEYVGLFSDFDRSRAQLFNQKHREALEAFSTAANELELNRESFTRYFDAYALLRAYIWLGGGFRAYCENMADRLANRAKVPQYYYDACNTEIQRDLHELDSEMQQEVEQVAAQYWPENFPAAPEAVVGLAELAAKYRFEHKISLANPLDLSKAYERVKQLVETPPPPRMAEEPDGRSFLTGHPHLRKWMELSIVNRVLQSDSHHIDARAKEVVRRKLLPLGADIFSSSFEEICARF
ncbi:MAG: hypothetical protein S4CHLAM81_12930 [Chlamydiales bacterium]|nr:hypothetical protein [Chlamydiales bacterium]MCH9636068.1 hypothetical protein [Chlamydiales bacterium]MCH9703221.1 hypothetical protein [Chlamydiota bacterium]